MEYTIVSDRLRVTATTLGAELLSVRYNDKEKLWQNQTGTWNKHSPVLFPVCGHCGCKVDGTDYPMPMHGVVRRAEFALKEKCENRMTFAFSSNEETKKAYPFDFLFLVTYTVEGATLSVRYDVENMQPSPLYFACGGHESFMLDGDVDGYKLVFDEEEEFLHRPHDGGGFLTGEKIYLGNGKELPVPKNYLLDGSTVILQGIRSDALTLCQKDGKALARVTFTGFENLLLWRPDNAAYMVCIEPWSNLPDLAGEEDGEFSQKAGVLKVEGAGKKSLLRTITYLD